MIVFQKDISDDEELCKEIADMYIENRAYYYSGKPIRNDYELSEKGEDLFIKLENIDFSKLEKIDY